MIYLLFPLFNEESNIENLFLDIQKISAKLDIKIWFVDDGSTDGTVTAIHKYFTGLNYDVLPLGGNYGPGMAFNEGFKKIIHEEPSDDSIVITMEADATSDIGILDKMIAISYLDFDVVLASVYAQGGGFEKTSVFRLLLSRTANLMIKTLYGIKVNTYTSFYRVYKIETLRKIYTLKKGQITNETGFICKLDILRSAIKTKASIIEVPVKLMTSRRQGKSKMIISRTMMEYLRYFFKRNQHQS